MNIKIGLLGFGTVGVGVYELLMEHGEKISQMTGSTLTVEKILVSNPKRHQEALDAGLPLTDQFESILQDPDIDIIVEVMGSIDTAREYIIAALDAGKNVVTANKDLLAVHGAELMDIAAENGKDLLFEASVAGGIPILRTLVESYAGDYITEVLGIVNGTTNFMLTQMQEAGKTYEEALLLAQEKGFAESDPSGDVEGMDAARKMVIVTKLAFGHRVPLEAVQVTGITSIIPADFEMAEKNGYTIKLIGKAKAVEEKIQVEVVPMLIPLNHPLAAVKNEYNALYVIGEAVGETMFYGPGAGRKPTANSVVSDIVYIAKNIQTNHTGHFRIYSSNIFKDVEKGTDAFDGVLRIEGNRTDAEKLIQSGLSGKVLAEAELEDKVYIEVDQLPSAKIADYADGQFEVIFKKM